MIIAVTFINEIVSWSDLIWNIFFSMRKQLTIGSSCVSWTMETISSKLSLTEKGSKQKKTFIVEQHPGYDLTRVPDGYGLIPSVNPDPHRHSPWWDGERIWRIKSMDGDRESSVGNAKATHKQRKQTWRVAVSFLHSCFESLITKPYCLSKIYISLVYLEQMDCTMQEKYHLGIWVKCGGRKDIAQRFRIHVLW